MLLIDLISGFAGLKFHSEASRDIKTEIGMFKTLKRKEKNEGPKAMFLA